MIRPLGRGTPRRLPIALLTIAVVLIGALPALAHRAPAKHKRAHACRTIHKKAHSSRRHSRRFCRAALTARRTSDTAAPGAPSNLSAAAGAQSVTLSWSAASDNVGVAGYAVYRDGTRIASVKTTSFTNTGLTDGTTYTYAVAAYDRAGNLSALSNAVSATPTDTSAPSAPASLNATAGDTQVTLSWGPANDNVGVAGYRILRNGTQVGQTTSTSATDSGLTDATTYQYSVVAFDAAGNVSAAAGPVSATPQSTTTTTTTTPPESTPRYYWGAWIGKQFTGSEAPWDWTAVTQFEQRNAGGKSLDIVHWSSPFKNSSGSYYSFGSATFQSVRDHGVIPFFSWANSGIADRDIAAGKYDSYITSWAQAARAWGHPFFLRYDWEMNGSWFSWGVGNSTTGNTASDYVAAWRHVHDIFTSVGATNATWVWCPNVDPGGKMTSVASVYPGDAYVDWTCLDGYNGNWTTFTDLFASTYDTITTQVAPTKPMIIGEIGSTESGGSKAQWISDMFAALPTRFPAIRGIVWFDKSETGPGGYTDWPIESSTSSSSAFAAGVQDSAFATNTYSTANVSPIPAP